METASTHMEKSFLWGYFREIFDFLLWKKCFLLLFQYGCFEVRVYHPDHGREPLPERIGGVFYSDGGKWRLPMGLGLLSISNISPRYAKSELVPGFVLRKSQLDPGWSGNGVRPYGEIFFKGLFQRYLRYMAI
jgi:hypothetical protein